MRALQRACAAGDEGCRAVTGLKGQERSLKSRLHTAISAERGTGRAKVPTEETHRLMRTVAYPTYFREVKMLNLPSHIVSVLFPLSHTDSDKKSTDVRFSYRMVILANLLVICALLSAALDASPSGGVQGMIARNGRPSSVIVLGDSAGPSDRFVAGELQRYVEMLSGARLEIISSHEIGGKAKDKSTLLVGSPASNELVRRAADRRQVNFEGLKPEGYILRRLSIEGHTALVCGWERRGGDDVCSL